MRCAVPSSKVGSGDFETSGATGSDCAAAALASTVPPPAMPYATTLSDAPDPLRIGYLESVEATGHVELGIPCVVTGGVSEPMIAQPLDMASMKDQERTNG